MIVIGTLTRISAKGHLLSAFMITDAHSVQAGDMVSSSSPSSNGKSDKK